jgi:hypothetical protein
VEPHRFDDAVCYCIFTMNEFGAKLQGEISEFHIGPYPSANPIASFKYQDILTSIE